MLNWADRFNICCFLDNHQYESSHHSVECILAAGCVRSVTAQSGNALDIFQRFHDGAEDWLFGHFGYDLKNETESLGSGNPDRIRFPDLFFFIPEIVVQLTADAILIGVEGTGHGRIFRDILNTKPPSCISGQKMVVQSRLSRGEYINAVRRLQQHILHGDCYEINFCQEFYAENASISPIAVYRALSNATPNPFSCLYKLEDKYLLCMSPERYLKKAGATIISQPIKGTARRDRQNESAAIGDLYASPKERAENIMIVDLVRNDFSKVCEPGTVQVDELCKVYVFPQVYQMISTVSGQLQRDRSIKEIIGATFPMGSMTGAPKKKVMELIDKYEATKRGLFAGSVGYFAPNGDFDLNVVIRSLLYNKTDGYLSFHTGSAITYSSDAEAEYEECLLKAEAIKSILSP